MSLNGAGCRPGPSICLPPCWAPVQGPGLPVQEEQRWTELDGQATERRPSLSALPERLPEDPDAMQQVKGQALADAQLRVPESAWRVSLTPGSEGSWLREQNACLHRALQDLLRQHRALEMEIHVLKNGVFPEAQKEIERLRQANAQLAAFTNELYQRYCYLYETTRRWMNNPVPWPIQTCAEETGMNSFSQQRAGERRDPARALLAQDQQNEVPQKAAEKFRAQLVARGEGAYMSTLKEMCRELEVQLSETTDKNTKLAEENASLREQMCLVETENAGLKEELQQIVKEQRRSTEVLSRLKAQLTTDKITKLAEENASLREQMRLVETENAGLKEKLQQIAKEQLRSTEVLSHLKAQLGDAKGRFSDVRDVAESAEGEVKRDNGEARQLFKAQVDENREEQADNTRGFILSDLLKKIQKTTWKERSGMILVMFLGSYLCWRKVKGT